MAAKNYKTKRKQFKRKTARANTKLMTIIGFTIAVAVIGLGGLWYFVEYRGAERNISSGDALVASGDYNKARKQYGRAVSKEPNNLGYIKKLRDTIVRITPSTPGEARSYYDDYIATLVHEARYNPLDIDTQLRVIQEMYVAARMTGQTDYWRRVKASAQAGLSRLAQDDPRRHELVLFLGLASLRIEDAQMTDKYDDEGNIRFPGEDDIESVLDQDPGNVVAWAALAHGRMAVYYRLQNEGRTQQAIRNRVFADTTMQKALDVAGDGFEVAETYYREMLLRRSEIIQEYLANRNSVTQVERTVADDAVVNARDRLVQLFDPNKHSLYTGEVATLLLGSGKDGVEPAIEILEKHIATNPSDVGRRLMLAELLQKEKRFEEAEEGVQFILDEPQQPVGLHAIEQYMMRPLAAQLSVQIAIEQVSLTEDETDRIALIEKAKREREVLSDLVSHNAENTALIYVDGLIALVEKRYANAAAKLEDVIRRRPQAAAQVYREAAIALAETGARGIANERLATALAKEPNNLANYLLKARIELMISDFQAAADTLAQLPPSSLSHPRVQELMDIIALRNASRQESRFTDPVLAAIAGSERSISLNEFERATTMITNAIDQTDPPDWRLFAAMSNIHIALEDLEEATVWMKKAVDLNPDSQELKNAMFVLEYDDRVSATIAYVESKDISDANKAEQLASMLFEISMNQMGESNRWSRMGNTQEATKSKIIADRALEESKKYQSIAEALGADMTRIIRVQFDQALIDQDMALAEQFIERLMSVSDDQLEINGARVRMLLATASSDSKRGNLGSYELNIGKAIDIAQRMTEEVPFSDFAWRTLGTTYTGQGDYLKALEAYAEAYRISPKALENIRRYIGSLAFTNAEPQRLLRVIRLAREQYPTNKQILAVWLDVEHQHGDRTKVLVYRFEQYKLKPDDRRNALALAAILVNTDPTRDLMLTADGSEIYTTRAWAQMQPQEKMAALQTTRDEWDATIELITEETSNEIDPDIRTAVLHASVLRDYGQLDEASETWDRFIETRKGTEEYTTAVIAAADFMQQAERIEQAISLLEHAKESQSDMFEIDAAMGSLLYLLGNHEDASQSLGVAVAASGDRILHARWIESLALSGRFEDAENALAQYASTNTLYSEAMLRALISRVKSEQLLAQGDFTLGTAELVKYRNALRAAIDVEPKNSIPYVNLCRSLLNEYRLTQNTGLLEEALQVADEGEALDNGSEQFVVVRADVLQADGQLHRAIDRMVRYMTQNPEASTVRQRLIEAYLDAEDVERAIAAARAGVDVNPSDPKWHHRLGDLHLRANDDRGKAVKSYLAALQREPSVRLLIQIDGITRTDQVLPDRAILTMVQGPMSKLHPITGAIEAKSLLNLGRRRDALIAMARSWRIFQSAITSGWIPESATASWFLDLKELFPDDPEAGEQFVLDLVGSSLSTHQQAGLAAFWQAYGEGHLERALGIIDAAITESTIGSPARARLLMLRGGYLVEVGRYEESAQAFRKLVDEQDSPIVINNLAYVIGVYLNKPEEGLLLAKQAAKRAPRSPSIVDTVATLYKRTGEFQKAAETLEFLLQIDPANAKAMARLALIYADKLNDPQRGVVFAERARSQNPRSPEVLDALGWSYYQTGRSAKGEEYLERSLNRGETMEAYLHLAQVVMARSDLNKALDHLRMAQEFAKDTHSLNRIKAIQDDIRKTQASAGE